MKVIISRTYGKMETISSFYIMEGEQLPFKCKAIELPDNGNQHKVSCIPEGIYDVVKWFSPSKGKCFHILNVPDRDNILIHSGNYATGKQVDTLGCILPGKTLIDINGDGNLDVTDSRTTMDQLLTILPDKFKLHIL
jgi:hypothetical protein